MKPIIIFAMCLSLWGCGFHLRGTGPHEHLPFHEVSVTPISKESLYRNLNLSLEALDIHQNPDASWQLQVTSPKLKTFPVAYGPNGELVREKLVLKTTYRLFHNQNLVQEKTISNVRQHQLNIATKLADQAELAIILSEMEKDLVSQMLIQIARV